MSYDDVEIEDMEWNEELQAFTYPCPCGDLFQITRAELQMGEETARCPSCSLYITVVYNMEDFQDKSQDNKNQGLEQAKTPAIPVAWIENIEFCRDSGFRVAKPQVWFLYQIIIYYELRSE